MKSRLFPLTRTGLVLIVMILEIFADGAVYRLSTEAPVGYSYFSLYPIGCGNFAPACTGIVSAVLLVLSIIGLIRPTRAMRSALLLGAIIAFVLSLCPLLLGREFYTGVGLIISIVLFSLIPLHIVESVVEKYGRQNP